MKPGVHFSRNSSGSLASVQLVTDTALSMRLSLDARHGVVVQFQGGAKEPSSNLFGAFALRFEDLLTTFAHRDVVRRVGEQYVLCGRVAPFTSHYAAPSSGSSIDLEQLEGRFAATDLFDEDTGEIVAEPGEKIDLRKLRSHGASYRSLAVPFALLSFEDVWLADRVFRSSRNLPDPLSASLATLPAEVADDLRKGRLVLGPHCRAAINEEFEVDIEGELLTPYDLALLWHALTNAEREHHR